MKAVFQSYQTIFSNTKIEDRYQYINYLKTRDTWTNSRFTWVVTRNKTVIGCQCYSKSLEMGNFKVFRTEFYFDATNLNLETMNSP